MRWLWYVIVGLISLSFGILLGAGFTYEVWTNKIVVRDVTTAQGYNGILYRMAVSPMGVYEAQLDTNMSGAFDMWEVTANDTKENPYYMKYSVFDVNEDGVKEEILFANAFGDNFMLTGFTEENGFEERVVKLSRSESVYCLYQDLNFDGMLDVMKSFNGDKSTTYILVDNLWIEAEKDGSRTRVVATDTGVRYVFENGEWIQAD